MCPFLEIVAIFLLVRKFTIHKHFNRFLYHITKNTKCSVSQSITLNSCQRFTSIYRTVEIAKIRNTSKFLRFFFVCSQQGAICMCTFRYWFRLFVLPNYKLDITKFRPICQLSKNKQGCPQPAGAHNWQVYPTKQSYFVNYTT